MLAIGGVPGKHDPSAWEYFFPALPHMRAGEFEDGAHVLRAKIDMADPHLILRDPLLYRIRHAHHHRTGDTWCIYPMYDFAHPPSDAIEKITHSLCTLEFEQHRPLYDWLIENLPVPAQPRQIEFARLNLSYTIMSKRKLLTLVEEGHVSGWDDPRMPTLVGMRRRGYTPDAIRTFCERIGVAKRENLVDVALLEHAVAVSFQANDAFLTDGDAVAREPLETLRLDFRRAVGAQHEIAAPDGELKRHADAAGAAAVAGARAPTAGTRTTTRATTPRPRSSRPRAAAPATATRSRPRTRAGLIPSPPPAGPTAKG